MTAFTSATNEATAVKKNVFENGIGKNSSGYGKTWTNTTALYNLLKSDYCVTFLPASDWVYNTSVGTIRYYYVPNSGTAFTFGSV